MYTAHTCACENASIGVVEHWMCGESWLARKDLQPTIPSSQGWASSVHFNFHLLLLLCMFLYGLIFSMYMYVWFFYAVAVVCMCLCLYATSYSLYMYIIHTAPFLPFSSCFFFLSFPYASVPYTQCILRTQ